MKTALLLGVPTILGAQTPLPRIQGSVSDAVTGRPLSEATIEVVGDTVRRIVQSEVTGRFTVAVPSGEYLITARRLGYQVAQTRLRLVERDTSIVIRLAPSPVVLPKVGVTARVPGVFGAIATSHEVERLPGVRVRLLGAGSSTETDSVGWFGIPVRKTGTYVVRTSKPGYVDQTITVQVPDSGIEILVLLDSGTVKPIPNGLLQEFDERLRWQGNGAAFVAGANLREHGGSTTDALNSASALGRRGLRISGTACVFVDGIPKPSLPVDAIPVEWIENVEVYTLRGEVTGTLVNTWPRGAPCGSGWTTTATSGNVRFVAIWLKR